MLCMIEAGVSIFSIRFGFGFGFGFSYPSLFRSSLYKKCPVKAKSVTPIYVHCTCVYSHATCNPCPCSDFRSASQFSTAYRYANFSWRKAQERHRVSRTYSRLFVHMSIHRLLFVETQRRMNLRLRLDVIVDNQQRKRTSE